MPGDGLNNPSDISLLALEETLDDIQDDLTLIQAALVIIDNDVGIIDTVVDAIRVVTDSTPVLTKTGGTLTSDGTEQDVYINNAPAGVYNPLCVKIDFTNVTSTEMVILRIYYRIATGGGLIRQDEVTYAGIPDNLLINIDLEPNRFGIEVTLELTAGTNRDFVWEVFYEETP